MTEQQGQNRRKPSFQFNNSHFGNMSERQTQFENDRILDINETDQALAIQFQTQNSARKKTQEVYPRHKGDVNVKIGSNIDFIVETEPLDLAKTYSDNTQSNGDKVVFKTFYHQNTNDNDKQNQKKFEASRSDEANQRICVNFKQNVNYQELN